MRLKQLFILGLTIASLGACNKKLDELLVNPNSPSPDKASADLYLTEMQLSFAGFYNGNSGIGGAVTRMRNFGSFNYPNAYSPQSFDGVWNSAYTGVFKHADALIPIATEQKKWVNVGMAKTIKAYTMMTLVDMFGDIPYAEANLGTENTNPALESGQSVYAKAITLLDEAIVAFNTTPVAAYPGTGDLFFGASNATGAGRWKTTAKLLKLRALVTTRLADPAAATKINALLADADVTASINSSANDFEFKYSTKQTNPNSRHPDYNANYVPTGTAGDYMANYFMWTLVQEKGTGSSNDPRTRYYFYRQRINFADANEQSLSCITAPPPPQYPADMPYCRLISGYWGRDHGDGSGIPPDGNFRTTFGIYPAGGEFDANQGTSVSLNRGGNGAGVLPLWQSAFTEFLKAECVLTLGTTGNARSLLASGIQKSLDKVTAFPSAIGASITTDTAYISTATRKTAYVNKVLAMYDTATTTNSRLNIVMKEWYIALFGNGIDAYNNYRRTGMPNNMQFMKATSPGPYIRSMYYPSDHVNLNQNATQKPGVEVQIFWDKNPAGFIK